MTTRIANNVRIYPWYQASCNFLPWLPLFFLYFNQHVGLADALAISATYYIAVFVLEVPSGYFSDRVGRKLILLLSSLAAVVAYVLFLVADEFMGFVIAQCFLAAYFALKSGSDTSLLYDSLQQLNRTDEYAEQEARAEKIAMLSLAAGCLAGGISGYYDLRYAYVLSVLSALFSFVICWQFKEPVQQSTSLPFFKQLQVTIGYLKLPLLLWIFCYFVLIYVLSHVIAEFNQPYIKLLSQAGTVGDSASAPISGFIMALSMLLGSLAVAVSLKLQAKLGVTKLLLLGLGFQLAIICVMAVVLHPIVLLAILFRNFPMALTHAPIMSTIAPHINSAQRATYLSVQSLAGRFCFAVVLYGLSTLVETDDSSAPIQWPELSFLLMVSILIGSIGFAIIWYQSKFLKLERT